MEKFKSDKGLMGSTHALSAVAFTLFFTKVANDFMFSKILGTRDILTYLTAIIIIIGASLGPDFDAVNSTSINVLGLIGSTISKIMRASSSLIQGTIKGPHDKIGDPHRGFWHTFVSAGLIGLIITWVTNIRITILTLGDVELTFADLMLMLIIYVSIQLTLASLFKKTFKKQSSNISLRLGILIFSLFLSSYLILFMPENTNYYWVGGAVSFGWIVHLLGDAMTKDGVPLLFPFKNKGKRWWKYRLPFGIKAGGYVEKTIIVPILSVVTLIFAGLVIPLLT